MNRNLDVIIVGSGLAGMAAAEVLDGQGLNVMVFDDNAHPGGQLLRQLPRGRVKGRFEPDPLKRRGHRMVQRLRTGRVRFLHDAQVLGIFPERALLAADGRGRVTEYHSDALILATGARERQLPFPGWTLPGVMATGAAQILMKSSGIFPGRKTIIGGCGPLMLVLAAQILTYGGRVQALLDQSKVAAKLGVVAAGPAVWPKLFEGACYLARLMAARVPMYQNVRIVESRGRDHLESVVFAHVDGSGRVIEGTETVCRADALAVGFGFAPNIELPLQAGCSVSCDLDKGGWIVDVSECMATSHPGVYAAGEPTGIAGAGKSFIEGQLAAWDILYRLGKVTRVDYDRRTRPLMHRRNQQVRYGRFLNRWCRLDPACYDDIPDETIICRCEEITLGEIRRQLDNGFTTLTGIKKATRCQMGNCQGRICSPILTDILSAYAQQPPRLAGCSTARAPVKPVRLGALANMQTVGGNRGENETGLENEGALDR